MFLTYLTLKYKMLREKFISKKGLLKKRRSVQNEADRAIYMSTLYWRKSTIQRVKRKERRRKFKTISFQLNFIKGVQFYFLNLKNYKNYIDLFIKFILDVYTLNCRSNNFLFNTSTIYLILTYQSKINRLFTKIKENKLKFLYFTFNLKSRQIKFLCCGPDSKIITKFSMGSILSKFLKTDYKSFRKSSYGFRIFWIEFKNFLVKNDFLKYNILLRLVGVRQTLLKITKRFLSKKLGLNIVSIIHLHKISYDKRKHIKNSSYVKRRIKKRLNVRINSAKFF